MGELAALMMDIQARYLVFHSVLVLLAGLLVGVPYARAVHRHAPDQIIRAWRLAHDTLTLGPTLGLAIAAVHSSLSVDAPVKSWLAWTWAISNYGFCFRSHSPPRWGSAATRWPSLCRISLSSSATWSALVRQRWAPPVHMGPEHWMMLSASADGSFAITNGRTGFTKRYAPRE